MSHERLCVIWASTRILNISGSQWRNVNEYRLHRRGKESVVWGQSASAQHEPITAGVWGRAPCSGPRGPAAEPLVRGRSPPSPEAESILVIGCPTEPANLAPFQKCFLNFVTRNKVLNHCTVIVAIENVM